MSILYWKGVNALFRLCFPPIPILKDGTNVQTMVVSHRL